HLQRRRVPARARVPKEQSGELLRRADPKVRGHTVEEPNRGSRRVGREDLDRLGKRAEGCGEIVHAARRRHEVDIADRFARAAGTSRYGDLEGEPRRRQVFCESLRPGPCRSQEEKAQRSPDGPDPSQVVLGALPAEARELLEPSLEAGPLERVEGVHAERVVELAELLRAQARNAQTIRETAREARPKLVVERQAAGP